MKQAEMMKLGYLLLPAFVLSSEQGNDASTPSTCGVYNIPSERVETYHGDQVCDRAQYNQFKGRLLRNSVYERLKKTNEINQVPNEKTVYCPLEVQDLLKEGQVPQVVGFDSLWIVENNSMEPIVLSFVRPDGIEYSAVNPSITPPQKDPAAVLRPSQWLSVFAWDGHVFHARSYDPETGNLGPVVLQHRMGLIPIGAKFQDLVCPVDDPEPLINQLRDPNFQRTPPTNNRPCNTVDIGFRNMANCPLNGYYIESSPDSCKEEFKFHLGKNPMPLDFMWGWDSPTKFEGSFVGHTFAFRSAANPEILVDTVTLQPTRVIDCPELKNKAQVNQVTKVGDLVEVSLPLTVEGDFATKAQHIEDVLIHTKRQFLSGMFNQTCDRNKTVASKRSGRCPLRTPLVGINSF